MTEKVKDILRAVGFGLLCGVCCSALVVIGYYKAKQKYNKPAETITVTDTITLTNVEFDTVFLTHISTDTLAVTDTTFLFDTINNTYYIPVEVPVSSHIIDTNIDTNIHLYESISGYKVNLDSLALEVKPIIIKPEKKFRIMPALGVGYGTGGWGAFGGVGIGYW